LRSSLHLLQYLEISKTFKLTHTTQNTYLSKISREPITTTISAMYLTNLITAYTTASKTSSAAMLIIALSRLSPSSHTKRSLTSELTLLTTPTATRVAVLLEARLLARLLLAVLLLALAVELATELVLVPVTSSEPPEPLAI